MTMLRSVRHHDYQYRWKISNIGLRWGSWEFIVHSLCRQWYEHESKEIDWWLQGLVCAVDCLVWLTKLQARRVEDVRCEKSVTANQIPSLKLKCKQTNGSKGTFTSVVKGHPIVIELLVETCCDPVWLNASTMASAVRISDRKKLSS